MTRPKYKALYEQKERDYQREYDRRARAEHRLAQIRKILAPEGKRIMESFDSVPQSVSVRGVEVGPIALSAHDFLCYTEYMGSLAGFTNDNDMPGSFRSYRWKTRPVCERHTR